jgi:hypothetical protein
MVGYQRHLNRPPGSYRPLASAAPPHCQPLLTVHTLHPFLVDGMALSPQQHVQTAIPEPSPLLGEGFEPLA